MRRAVLVALALVLLAGTAAAFAVAEALKLEGFPVRDVRFDAVFSPVCECESDVAALSFFLRESDRIDVAIVNREGEDVRTLAENRETPRGRVELEWDGRGEAGRVVPDGAYRLRLHLDEKRRTISIPTEVEVDTEPPSVELLRVSRDAISPDGDGRGEDTRIAYRASEPAGPVLLVDSVVAREWPPRLRRSNVRWDGRAQGSVLPRGPHTVAIRVRDRAGNLSDSSSFAIVRIRYLDLDRSVYVARRGRRLRFRVDADARTIRWVLRNEARPRALSISGRSDRRTVRVRLPERLRPGRYVLRVSASGHSDRALVRIQRRRR